MKSKGAVKFFAIALALVCLFQLSFTFVANQVEKKAERYAHGNEVKKRRYLDSIAHQPVYNLLVTKYTYQQVKERELNLGLDLRGGMHVTMEVDMAQMLKQISNNNENPAFNAALQEAKRQQVTSQRSYIDLFYDEIKKQAPNTPLNTYFATLENKESISSSSTDEQVLAYLRTEADNSLDRTFKIIRTRIDKFGVTQPNVQIDQQAGRIIVELPGVDDAERVRKLLKNSAKLEFYETYTLNELFPFLQDADRALAATMTTEKADSTTAKGDDTSKAANSNPLAGFQTNDTSATAATKDSASKNTPLLSALFPFQVTKDMAESATIGYVTISDTAKINAMLRKPEVKDAFPPELKFAWSAKTRQGTDLLELTALRTTGLEGKEAVLYGDVITHAKQDVDPQTHGYVVSMQMNSQGASEWANITKRNINKQVAIVLDDQVYSAPNVNSEITGGNSQISGNFNVTEAKDLANILEAGKLPVELNIIDEAVVGPSLGVDNINKGLMSLIVGVIAIILFMVVYYNRGGWVANLALIINLFFIIGVLTSLQAALTLPGMAGIVLTLAMAVDANVLIYERIREELLLGKGMRLAVSEGFKNALSSIVDGNLTTLLIGIILMAFGSGPIYGFAVVLVIGILTSMFTAILISRIIFEWLLEKDKKVNFGNKITNNLFHGINFDFVGKRKIGYWFSAITIAIGIASLFINGLNYGVEFKGGYSYVVSFDQPVNTDNVRNTLTKTFGSAPEVKTYGSDERINIITDYLVDQPGDNTDALVTAKLKEGLSQLQGGHYKIESTQKVGSTIASDIKNSAFLSIVLGLLAVFLYIVVRFKRWQFAAGATIALAHDVFFTLSLFSIFKDVMPFSSIDQTVVAALLTVVGYSINDTVVVFDRIREYLRNNKKSPMVPTVNAAINTTLNRTVITSFTVFVAVLILFIFGGQVIRGFAFAMLVGVTIGTYSSIFVATPIALDLQKKSELDSTTF